MLWSKCGQENTERTVSLAVKRAKELEIEKLLLLQGLVKQR